jgi:uncharacterized cupredoxin-like copper-binding protein
MSRKVLGPITAGLLLLAACGDDTTSDAGGDNDARIIEIEMVDIAFEPESIEVAAGETVRFVFTNNGEIAHDAYIGDGDAQGEHETEMRDAEGSEHGGGHGGGDEEALTVDPGETGELTHTFEESGSIEIGCHQPGHYNAGMKITVEVG